MATSEVSFPRSSGTTSSPRPRQVTSEWLQEQPRVARPSFRQWRSRAEVTTRTEAKVRPSKGPLKVWVFMFSGHFELLVEVERIRVVSDSFSSWQLFTFVAVFFILVLITFIVYNRIVEWALFPTFLIELFSLFESLLVHIYIRSWLTFRVTLTMKHRWRVTQATEGEPEREWKGHFKWQCSLFRTYDLLKT